MNDKTDIEKVAGTPGTPSSTLADLKFLVPLLDKVRTVEIRFHGADTVPAGKAAGDSKPADLEARVRALEAELAALKATRSREAAPAVEEPFELVPQSWARTIAAAVTIVVLLTASHWLIVFVYDGATLMLRLASLLIPAFIAFQATRRHAVKAWPELAVGLAVGVGAVLAMSYATAVHEGSTVLPANAREWRETARYVASIAFAYVTGVLAAGAVQLHSHGGGTAAGPVVLVYGLARAIAGVVTRGWLTSRNLDTVTKFIAAVMPLVSAIVAIVTSVKAIIG